MEVAEVLLIDDIIESKNKKFRKKSYLYNVVKLIEKKRDKVFAKPLKDALRENELNIIGEVRKSFPELNMENKYFDIKKIAEIFSERVEAISIVTEEFAYDGKNNFIKDVKEITDLPIIKRGFFISPLEVFYSKPIGASSVVLVSRILDGIELKEYVSIAKDLEIEPIVEVQTNQDMEKAVNSGTNYILINTTLYEDFSYEPELVLELSRLLPDNIKGIAEFQKHTEYEIKLLKESRINTIILSTDLLNKDIEKKIKEIRNMYSNILEKKEVD